MKKHSQKLGADFEKRIRKMHDRYETEGRGCFWPNEVRSRVIRIPGGRTKVIQAKSPPDFGGILPGGKYVLFDAKSVPNVKKWTLPKDKSHQYDLMMRVSRFGALCFFLLEARKKDGLCYIILVNRFIADRFYPQNRPTARLDLPGQPHVLSFLPTNGRIDWLSTIHTQVSPIPKTMAPF